jgi:hypothetical protein
MSTPSERIARLDASLDRAGQIVQIQRPGGTTDITNFSATADCQAKVAGTGVGISEVILSPTSLINAPNWPEANPPQVGDPLLPRKTDKIFVNGLQRTIQNVYPRYTNGGVLIRVVLEVSA